MEEVTKITIRECCHYYKVEESFVYGLHQYGLIELTNAEEEALIEVKQLHQLEKYRQLYYELEINLQGLEAIKYLLERIANLQATIHQLKTG